MMPKKETPRHRLAFESYWTMGDARSLKKVGEVYGVSQDAVENWSRAFKWQERLTERERVVGGIISERSKMAEVEMRERVLNICRAVMVRFAQALDRNGVRVKAGEFARVAELELLVRGFPTSREEHMVRGRGPASDRRALIDSFIKSVPEGSPSRRFVDALRRRLGPDLIVGTRVI